MRARDCEWHQKIIFCPQAYIYAELITHFPHALSANSGHHLHTSSNHPLTAAIFTKLEYIERKPKAPIQKFERPNRKIPKSKNYIT